MRFGRQKSSLLEFMSSEAQGSWHWKCQPSEKIEDFRAGAPGAETAEYFRAGVPGAEAAEYFCLFPVVKS